MSSTDDLYAILALHLRHGRHLPVQRLGMGVCAVCGGFLAPGVLYCPTHPEASVFIHLLDEEDTPDV
jgi:hypothetical protein